MILHLTFKRQRMSGGEMREVKSIKALCLIVIHIDTLIKKYLRKSHYTCELVIQCVICIGHIFYSLKGMIRKYFTIVAAISP